MDLEEYIRQKRKKRISYEDIKNSLLNAKWNPEMIENAISISKASEIKRNGITLVTIVLAAIVLLAVTMNITTTPKTQLQMQLDEVVDVSTVSSPKEIIEKVDKKIDTRNMHISRLVSSDSFFESSEIIGKSSFNYGEVFFYFTLNDVQTKLVENRYQTLFYVDVLVINPMLEIDDDKSELVYTMFKNTFDMPGKKDIEAFIKIAFDENDTKGKYTIIIKAIDMASDKSAAKAVEIELV